MEARLRFEREEVESLTLKLMELQKELDDMTSKNINRSPMEIGLQQQHHSDTTIHLKDYQRLQDAHKQSLQELAEANNEIYRLRQQLTVKEDLSLTLGLDSNRCQSHAERSANINPAQLKQLRYSLIDVRRQLSELGDGNNNATVFPQPNIDTKLMLTNLLQEESRQLHNFSN